MEELACAVQQVTGRQVELAYVDQCYTGERAAAGAQEHGTQLEVVKLPKPRQGKKQFVL